MGLREQAAADLRSILEDQTNGFGWPLTLTSPDDVEGSFSGLSTDVGFLIDPQTGMGVTSRSASVALPIQALLDAGFAIPTAVPEKTSKPWRVTLKDVHDVTHTFTVSESRPDRALGVVVLVLELWKP